jgi:hypothetical protein
MPGTTIVVPQALHFTFFPSVPAGALRAFLQPGQAKRIAVDIDDLPSWSSMPPGSFPRGSDGYIHRRAWIVQ